MADYQAQCETMLLEGQWDQAQQAALAWARHPATGADRDPRPHFALNVIHLLAGVSRSLKTHPKCLQEPEDIAQVKEWIEEFVARQSEQAYAHLVMGLFLAQSGQAEQSIAAYKQSAKLAPQSAYPHYFLAQIHERANHLEMAIKEYRETVRLDPSYAPARPTWAWLIKTGRLEMAIPQYREVIKLNPNDSVAHANLACALAEQGKMEPALQSYKEALRLNPRMQRCISRWEVSMKQGAAWIWHRGSTTRLSSPIRTSGGAFCDRLVGVGQTAHAGRLRSLQSSPQVQRGRSSGLPRIAEYYSQKGKRESALDNFAKGAQYYKDPEKKMRF